MVGRRGRFLVVEPLFERGPQLALGGGLRMRGGEMVLAEPLGPRARVVAELGDPARARDVAAAVIYEHGREPGFDPELSEAAREAARRARAEVGDRHDLTALDTLTVDPETARDFDDAVSASEEGDGIRLWIHIADVAAHVQPETPLDAEAERRATSVYVPGAVEPMLPAELSSDACSLAPGVERLAVTVEVVVGADGAARSPRFYRSRIRSDARLSYEELDEFFAGRAAPPERIAAPLELARRAAAALKGRRRGRALEISTAEPEFEFDGEGNVISARAVEQTEAHSLIEQLMICANEQVAEQLRRRGTPTLYRVHEQPDPARVVDLIEKLAALEVPTPPAPQTLTPTAAAELVAQASRLTRREAERRGHGRAAYTSLVLRSLKPAFYSPQNIGHAGLASPAYCHFTSPIRRYPDLVAHRALLSGIGAGELAPDRGSVREAGWWCSEREREAMTIERDADDVCAAFLLERELFEAGPEASFDGEVAGLIGAGAFIGFAGALADTYEGFLPARRLGGERYDLDQTETAIVGRRSGRRIRLGDPVTVRVDGVEAPRGRVDLVPAPEEL